MDEEESVDDIMASKEICALFDNDTDDNDTDDNDHDDDLNDDAWLVRHFTSIYIYLLE